MPSGYTTTMFTSMSNQMLHFFKPILAHLLLQYTFSNQSRETFPTADNLNAAIKSHSSFIIYDGHHAGFGNHSATMP